MFLVCFFLLAVGVVSAQLPVQFGIKAGVPLTDNFELGPQNVYFNYSSQTNRYTIGPMIEIRNLPLHLSFEFDALYKRLHYDHSYDEISGGAGESYYFSSQYVSNRWEFPLLLKYKPPLPRHIFYVSVGPTVNYVTDSESTLTTTAVSNYSGDKYTFKSKASALELKRISTGGVVAGGGCNFHIGPLHLSPELRYTRWLNRNFAAGLLAPLQSNQNQLDVLLGLTF
jgi:hypothetical protein